MLDFDNLTPEQLDALEEQFDQEKEYRKRSRHWCNDYSSNDQIARQDFLR